MTKPPESFLSLFGMDAREVGAAVNRAQSLLSDPQTVKAMDEFTDAGVDIDKRKSDAVRANSNWLAGAGRASMAAIAMEGVEKFDSWPTLLGRVLIHPPCYRDLADWWLFFAALEAETGFQLGPCTGQKREARLSGHLLEALATQGKQWAEAIAPAVSRYNATLGISEIDLEIGGGEQATGGDFGLILDFDGRTIQPSSEGAGEGQRIIPMIFQAKRYRRPSADISQTNPTRGPQRTLLASNVCAAAYILYENEGNPATPLPPLVKPIQRVPPGTKTNALEDSLDFATYLLRAAIDPTITPRARSADDALRMIYNAASPKDLTALVVISADPGAANRYRSGVSMLNHELRHHGDEDQHLHAHH